jgi:predicted nicotinamide N-methyase
VTDAEFVRGATELIRVPLVQEVWLRQGREAFGLWERTEASQGQPLPPPFWAFPWAGGQALARYVLDHPELVRGRRVLDLATGSGLVAVAAAKAGAAPVRAADIDPLALAAVQLNAAANGVTVAAVPGDVLDGRAGADVVLAGDVCYERAFATRAVAFLRRAAAAGALVLLGDPGRAYLPESGLELVARYAVPVIEELEDAATKPTSVWKLTAEGQ